MTIMVLSFLPVFALGGIEGKMFHPLAYTKTFALMAVAGLAITLVPALCTIFIRGRLRSEMENPLIRSVIEVYRPVLSYLMDRPAALAWVLGVTFLLGLAPLGSRPIFLARCSLAMVATAVLPRRRLTAVLAPASLLVVALVADQTMQPLAREFMTPLDEGMVMDMPITVPRASVTEAVDDLKARDMVLCRFPEVDMVVGKAGRAETPTDPAPMDMIETMVNFRPRELWPRRKLRTADAEMQARAVCDALIARRVIQAPETMAARQKLIEQSVTTAMPLFDAASREFAYHRNQEMLRNTGGISPTSMSPTEPAEARVVPRVAAAHRHIRCRADRPVRADFHAVRAGAAPRLCDHHRPRGGIFQNSLCEGSRGQSGDRDAAASADGGRRPSPSWLGRQASLEPLGRAAAHARRDPGRALSQLCPPALALEGRS